MKNLLKMTALTLLLTSCGTTSEVIKGPNGTPHHLLSCSNAKSCYEEASNICGGKYKIANTSSETSNDYVGNTYTTTKMLIKCDK